MLSEATHWILITNNPMRQAGTLLSPLHRWGSWNTERLNKPSKATQLATSRAGLESRQLGSRIVSLTVSLGRLSITNWGSTCFFLFLHKREKNWKKIESEYLWRFLAPQISKNQGRELHILYIKSRGYFAGVDSKCTNGDRKRIRGAVYFSSLKNF